MIGKDGRDERPAELPDDLADRAAERLLAVTGKARAAALAELVAAHPEHEAALRVLCGELGGVEQLLDAQYADPAEVLPAHVGGHRVLQRLGEGAFGIVYLCAQEHPVVRQVAVKVLRPGAGDPKTLQRFAAERQLLAQLNHPGITQVFDAGELPDGRPFFVMEYVDGTPLHTWCTEHELPCPARLRLFVAVCRAVAHAHARGIVHRDLKPANVLVVATPDGPAPKVIDFGIAKAIGDGAGIEPRTEAGRVIGTPGYMSPEQAAGRIADVDARADVFALGVMLYELLTDQMPWARTTNASATDPVRPSARVTTGARPTDGATTQRHRLAAELRGDLDWITLKAIARERDERYGSVAELAADVERHLRGETVSVGPPSLHYRLRKFVRRNRAAVVAATVCAVIASVAAIVFFEAARRNAAAGLADCRAFVQQLLRRANDPELFANEHGDEVRRALGSEALAFAERLLATRSDDPGLQRDRCDALQLASEVHRVLGELTPARLVAARAVAVAQELANQTPDDAERRGLLGSALRQQACALAMAGDVAGACTTHETALVHLEAAAREDAARWGRLLAVATSDHAAALSTRGGAAAIATYENALSKFDEIRGDPEQRAVTQADYVAALLGLGSCLLAAGRLEEAAAQVDRVAGELAGLEQARRRATIDFHLLRARIAWARGGRKDTIADFEAAAAATDAWCAEQPRRVAAHRYRIEALDSLGHAANYSDDFDAATAASRRAIAAAETMVGQFPDDPTARASLCLRLCQFAYLLRDRFRLQPLTEAADNVARAFEHDALLEARNSTNRVPRWKLLTFRAGVEESRGDPAAPGSWREVEGLVPTTPEANDGDRGYQLEAFTRIAHTRLAGGEPAAALPWLARARALINLHPSHRKRLVEIDWLQANIAFLAGDPGEAVMCADRIMKARGTWFGLRRAGDCMRLAAACAKDPTIVKGCRARAIELYKRTIGQLDADVAKNPDDPWFLIPWGASMVRLAELAETIGELDVAKEQVELGLAKLDAARPDAQHDQWDEDAYRAGVALRARLSR